MIVKVKEPVASEYGLMREGQTVYTYFHLAADRPLTKALLERRLQRWPTRPSRPTTDSSRC